MPEMTVSKAKNAMRRAVKVILEGALSASGEDAVWAFFECECAYCGKKLDRNRREGHLDHADPAGGNHLGNRVLACAACNGNEKREESWEAFLTRKAPGEAIQRAERIRRWMAAHPPHERRAGPEIDAALSRVETVIGEYQAACDLLRAAIGSERAR